MTPSDTHERRAAAVLRDAPFLHLRVYGRLYRYGKGFGDLAVAVLFGAAPVAAVFFAMTAPPLRTVPAIISPAAIGMFTLVWFVTCRRSIKPVRELMTAASQGHDHDTLRLALVLAVETGTPVDRVADAVARTPHAT